MRKYSDLFTTLYDEDRQVGDLGRGTHYSIFRAPIWHTPGMALSIPPKFLSFGIVWDEDHDERIVSLLENLYLNGFLFPGIIFAERKGFFMAILDPKIVDKLGTKWLKNYESVVESMATDIEGDSWSAEILTMQNPHALIGDEDCRVRLYLENMISLWHLGIK